MTRRFNKMVRLIRAQLSALSQHYVFYNHFDGTRYRRSVITNPRLGPLLHHGGKARRLQNRRRA